MTEEEMLVLAEKIGNGTATEEEQLAFATELNKLIGELKNDLSAE